MPTTLRLAMMEASSPHRTPGNRSSCSIHPASSPPLRTSGLFRRPDLPSFHLYYGDHGELLVYNYVRYPEVLGLRARQTAARPRRSHSVDYLQSNGERLVTS